MWSARNIKSLFPPKDKVGHQSCVIYEGKYSFKLSYKKKRKEQRKETVKFVGKNTKILLENQPAKLLIENASHKFSWKVLSIVHSYFRRKKILEGFFIALRNPALNDQLEHHFLSLFCHVIT